MSFTAEEFAAQPPELQRVMIELEKLRQADANLYGSGRPNWEAKRRLAIYAECCNNREPLIEIMNTEPPCVLVSQAHVSMKAQTAEPAEREPWQGVGRARGSVGLVWLTTFERMAGTHLRYELWCRDHHWYVASAPSTTPKWVGLGTEHPKLVADPEIWIPLNDVLTKRGRHVVRLPDKRDTSRTLL